MTIFSRKVERGRQRLLTYPLSRSRPNAAQWCLILRLVNVKERRQTHRPPKEIAPLFRLILYMINGNSNGWTTTDYEKISDRELSRLLEERMPEKKAPEVTDYNRQTMIAILKFLSAETR